MIDMKTTIWNLMQSERRLVEEGKSIYAWDIRQVLDLLSWNWRIVKSVDDLEINEITEGKNENIMGKD